MIRRLTERSVETDALLRFIRVFLLLSAISIPIGFIATSVSFTHRSYEHISALFPELRHLDSVYIESRGFPFAQWATNDPQRSGFGELRSAFLPSGIIANVALFSVLTFFVVTLVWLLVRLVAYMRNRVLIPHSTQRPATPNKSRLDSPPPHSIQIGPLD